MEISLHCLDIAVAIREYLKATGCIRWMDSLLVLFSGFSKGHSKSKSTIAWWVHHLSARACLLKAKSPPVILNAHSIKSVEVFWAFWHQASVAQLCKTHHLVFCSYFFKVLHGRHLLLMKILVERFLQQLWGWVFWPLLWGLLIQLCPPFLFIAWGSTMLHEFSAYALYCMIKMQWIFTCLWILHLEIQYRTQATTGFQECRPIIWGFWKH